ncbi:glycosyl hydrolase family 28-related protein [Tunicatimonas pelagia]|uniref:glycosyl hydrolase family 28-related protein n=1 Tax=Tunicatimonas pelagia TaxID=931531 RepID=UPI002666F028|nr:glycosyl hydrolase family 28-related protein [Tunicatimonas pelagia]WKN40707.1 glycosyl hydrolase family 28-related protein [Tunicatimonas pelagia]
MVFNKVQWVKTAICPLIINCLVSYKGVAQELDSTRITDWNIVDSSPVVDNVGSSNSPQLLSFSENIYNIVEWFGADNTGETDVSPILQHALNSTPEDAVIYFPAGAYFFRKGIIVPSHKTIRGASPLLTTFKFDLISSESTPFLLRGEASREYYPVSKTFPLGSNKIVIEGASQYFNVGDDIELERENIPREMYTMPLWEEFASEWIVGQMLSIRRIANDTIHLDRSLTLDYDDRYEVRIQKVNMIEDVGLEGFSLERLDRNLPGNNFSFGYAKDSWISCVRSHYTSNTHVSLSASRDCEIKGSYFDDAHFHCAGGMGYGVAVRNHSSENHIYNNVFTNLRHSMLVSQGANRNVFSYNYSAHTKISRGNAMQNGYCEEYMDHPAVDISIHGYYSFMNLFEHNAVQRIISADYWGPSGPGTTFFRNTIETDMEFVIKDSSVDHNVIGNVIPGEFRATSSVKGTIKIKNNIASEIDTLPWVALPPSLYLNAKPDFYGELPWPSIAPDPHFNYNTNPAKERWQNRKLFDELCCGSTITIPDSRVFVNDSFYAFLKDNTLYIHGNYSDSFDVAIYTTNGRFLQKNKNVRVQQGIPIGNSQTASTLIVHLSNNEFATPILVMATI